MAIPINVETGKPYTLDELLRIQKYRVKIDAILAADIASLKEDS